MSRGEHADSVGHAFSSALLSVYMQMCELQGLGRRFSFTALLCSFILILLQAIKKFNLRPPAAISCQVPSGYQCGAVSGGSSTTTCASPSCSNGYSGAASAGAAACTTGTGFWTLSGCTGRLRLKCVTRGTHGDSVGLASSARLISQYMHKCELQGLGSFHSLH